MEIIPLKVDSKINPFTPKSDKHLIFLTIISPQNQAFQVTRIREMINK